MRKIIFSAVTVIGLSLLSQNVAARSWRINSVPDAKANFLSINAAMESLDVINGDTLYLDPGCVLEGQDINKSVTVIGTGYNLQEETTREAVINGTLRISAPNVKVEGIHAVTIEFYKKGDYSTVERCKAKRIESYFGSSNEAPKNLKVHSCYVYEQLKFPYSINVEISNCIITGDIKNLYFSSLTNCTIVYTPYQAGNYVFGNLSNSTIINNIIINTLTGYRLDENQKPFYYKNEVVREVSLSENNTISNNVFSVDADHAFANYPNNKFIGATPEDVFTLKGNSEEMYKLKAGSPAAGYGANGYDCGAFSGQYPYVMSGRPRFIPYIYEANIPNQPTDGKLNVTLKIRTQNE